MHDGWYAVRNHFAGGLAPFIVVVEQVTHAVVSKCVVGSNSYRCSLGQCAGGVSCEIAEIVTVPVVTGRNGICRVTRYIDGKAEVIFREYDGRCGRTIGYVHISYFLAIVVNIRTSVHEGVEGQLS